MTPSRSTVRPLILLSLLAATLAGGCQQNPYRFKAATLPVEWQAEKTANVQEIDLSRLAAPTASSELIAQGDVLEVFLTGGLGNEESRPYKVRVSDRGTVNLPVIGDVDLNGLYLDEAEGAIAAAAINGGLYRSPQVTVTMHRPKVNRITVIGAVEEQGVYELRPGQSDLLQAITMAGGLAENAGTHVEIRHPRGGASDSGIAVASYDREDGVSETAAGGHSVDAQRTSSVKRTVRVDLVSAAKEGSNGYFIGDGGVVMVEKRDPAPVHVGGLVKEPASVDFPVGEDLRVLEAITLAGGEASLVANKVYVIRHKPGHDEPALITVSIRKAKRNGAENIRLMPGDTVMVEQTPATILLESIRAIGFNVGGALF